MQSAGCGNCCASVFRVVGTTDGFDPNRDAPNGSCLPVMERISQPAWVFSAETSTILWSNSHADRFFGRDLLQPEPPSYMASKRVTEGVNELRKHVEEAGSLVEVEWLGIECTCGGATSMPGLPALVSGAGPLVYMPSGYKLAYSPIVMPLQPGGASRTCCLVQMIGPTPPLDKDEILRVLQMHNACPIFRYMFDKEGKLLTANCKALTHYKSLAYDEELSLWLLFKLALYDNEEDRETDYFAAMDCVFEQQKTFRCQQQRLSLKGAGQKKWVELEMWPMIDPITKQRAVQVSQMSLTKTKKAEVALKNEYNELQQKLEEKEMQGAVDKPGGRRTLHYESPMEKLVKLFDSLMDGGPVPDKDTLINYRHMITSASNLGQPLDLLGDLLEDGNLEKDVGLSILQQLGCHLGKRKKEHKMLSQATAGDLGRTGSLDMGIADFDMTRPSLSNVFTQSSRDFSTSVGSLYESRHGPKGAFSGKTGPFGVMTLPIFDDEKLPTINDDAESSSEIDMNQSLADMEPFTTLMGAHVVPVLERILRRAQDWDFNVFELEQESQGNPLSVISFFLLNQTGLTRTFHLDEKKLSLWLRSIENSYQDNHYHNRIHAADVTHSMFVMLTRGGLHQGLNRVQILAPILAAIVHDVDHPGRTNDFLVVSEDPLSIDYNDTSPLENHHLAYAFKLMKKPEHNFMEALDKETYRSIRALVIDLVIATDMKRHFDILSQFQMGLSIKSDGEPDVTGAMISGKAFNAAEGIRKLWVRIPDEQMNDEQHALKLKVALKVADLGHLAAPREVHKKWVNLLQQEFFCQGDVEKDFDMPVSPLMDRTKPGITTSQVGFFEVVAIPLFKSLVTAYSSCQPMMDALEENYNMWAGTSQGHEAPEGMTASAQLKKLKMRRRMNTI